MSLPFHFDELYALLSELNRSTGIIVISESHFKSSSQLIVKINLENYCVDHTPTESSNGGTLLYIKKMIYPTNLEMILKITSLKNLSQFSLIQFQIS